MAIVQLTTSAARPSVFKAGHAHLLQFVVSQNQCGGNPPPIARWPIQSAILIARSAIHTKLLQLQIAILYQVLYVSVCVWTRASAHVCVCVWYVMLWYHNHLIIEIETINIILITRKPINIIIIAVVVNIMIRLECVGAPPVCWSAPSSAYFLPCPASLINSLLSPGPHHRHPLFAKSSLSLSSLSLSSS